MTDVVGENIRVVTRVRPMLDDEPGESFVTVVDEKKVEVKSHSGVQVFEYDAVLGTASSQQDVYDTSCTNVLQAVLNGYNGAVIAYGQTASGKTHTMTGDDGVVPTVARHLFSSVQRRENDGSGMNFEISCSYIQLYCEKIYDMLDEGRSCTLQTGSGLFLSNASNVPVTEWDGMVHLLKKGERNRIVHETGMNKASSRSHSVLLLTLLSRSGSVEKMSQLYLVDLAGSECVEKTKSKGEVLQQAKSINLSLLSLRRVITSLVKKAQHIPYRDSMLTRILESAVGGNSVTTIIICVSPSSYNLPETTSSLRFGMYTGSITNVAVQNVVRSTDELEELLRKLYKEIEAALITKKKLEIEVKQHQHIVINGGVKMDSSIGRLATQVSSSGFDIPQHFICPLGGKLMLNPVTLADGITYERDMAEKYILQHKRPPRKVAACAGNTHLLTMIPNLTIRGNIEAFIAEYVAVQKQHAW